MQNTMRPPAQNHPPPHASLSDAGFQVRITYSVCTLIEVYIRFSLSHNNESLKGLGDNDEENSVSRQQRM